MASVIILFLLLLVQYFSKKKGSGKRRFDNCRSFFFGQTPALNTIESSPTMFSFVSFYQSLSLDYAIQLAHLCFFLQHSYMVNKLVKFLMGWYRGRFKFHLVDWNWVQYGVQGVRKLYTFKHGRQRLVKCLPKRPGGYLQSLGEQGTQIFLKFL